MRARAAMWSCPEGPGLVVSSTAARGVPPTVNSTFTGWPYPYSFAAPDAFDSWRETRAVTATGAPNNAVRYRSSRSFDSSGIGAPPANPAGTSAGICRGQDHSPTAGGSIEATRPGFGHPTQSTI